MKHRSQAKTFPVSVVKRRKEYVGSYEIIRGKAASIRVFFIGRQREARLGLKDASVLAQLLLRELVPYAVFFCIQAQFSE